MSEPSTVLLDKPPLRTDGHGNHQRKPSNPDSSFSGEDIGPSVASSRASGQLGLHLVHDPQEAVGDLIFIHGLGGSPFKTWSFKRDASRFWPAWFGDDGQLQKLRTFTFGYNSNYRGNWTNLNITDFAKDLLFHLLTFSQDNSKPIGCRQIVFIAHSLGGLVVKKAYVIGKHDPEYSDIVSRIYGMLFLATPHRGAQYAKMLNNILSTAPMGAPPKAYVADLDNHSVALQDINEQFRTICQDLVLVSFFETMKTGFGPGKVLVCSRTQGRSPSNANRIRSLRKIRPSWGILTRHRAPSMQITIPYASTRVDKMAIISS